MEILGPVYYRCFFERKDQVFLSKLIRISPEQVNAQTNIGRSYIGHVAKIYVTGCLIKIRSPINGTHNVDGPEYIIF
jgi:hypothetical protein